MEIVYLENGKIDRDKYDHCIAKSFNGLVYAYSWYLDAVCDEWNVLVQGDYVRVFPLPVKKKFGIHIVYQPFFTQQLGLFSLEIISKDILKSFLNAIPTKYKYIELCLNTHNRLDSSFKNKIRNTNFELDLINAYQKIRKKYSKNLLRNLKKAERHQLSLVQSIKPDHVIKLFTENKGKQIKHLKDTDYLRFKRLIYSAIYKGMADVYGVYSKNNELIAGAIFIRSHHRASFMFSGLNDTGRKSVAMAFLLNEYIKNYSNRHLTFDFEGSNDKMLARFYKSFGAKKTSYTALTLNKMNFIQHFIFRTYRFAKKLI